MSRYRPHLMHAHFVQYSKDDVLHGGRSIPSAPDQLVRNLLGDGFCGRLTGQGDVKRP